MLELQHCLPEPTQLESFRNSPPKKTSADWDSQDFHVAKQSTKIALRSEQDQLCVYCEIRVHAPAGHVEHIKPKSGPNPHPHLCFVYSNLALSCDNQKTCGHKKKAGVLPIEPAPGCNSEWTVSTDGTIEPLADLTRARRHDVVQTRDMLGLNKDSNLVDERKRWLASALEILQSEPGDLRQFLAQAPFRAILATAF